MDGGLSSGQFTLEAGTPSGFDPFHANTNGTATFDSTTTGPTTSGSGPGGSPLAGDNVYARFEGVVNDTDGYPKTLTVLAGVTGNTIDPCASSTSRVLEIEMAFGDNLPDVVDGGRIKAYIRENCNTSTRGLQIENFDGSGPSPVAAMPDTSGFHIYHIAVTMTAPREASVQVYIDGTTTPAIDVTTTTLRESTAAGLNYLRIGDGGGNQYRGTIDWIIWTTEAAYSAADLVNELPNGIGELGLYDGGGSATCVAGMSISNTTIDCEGETVGLTCPNDSEGQPAVFTLSNATLKNVRIAANGGADGVHCISGDCVLENVIWEDVCEDAASLVSNGVTMTIIGGSAFNDTVANGSPGGNPDKIFQHNSKDSTTIVTGGFRAHGRNGKLWRACGDCTNNGGPRHLVVDDVIIEGIIGDVAGPNGNYGDTVTISNLQIENYTPGNPKVCLVWTGVEKGSGSSTQVGEQFNTATCIVDPSDITSFP